MRHWLALLLLATPAAAQFGDNPAEVQGAAVDPADAGQVEAMKKQLLEDPSVRAALVERIMQSQLADRFSVATDRPGQRREIAEFIEKDPDSAAQVAIGLSRDDAEGSHRYENTLLKHTRSKLVFNAGSQKGVLGRLKKASDQSRLMGKQENQDMAEEEKQELLKTMFEGEGTMNGRVLTLEKDGKAGAPGKGEGPTAALADGYYDRLSAGNLRGYSPQLLALQSALNQRRPPGAPALIETGKLDHLTLSYPGFGMKFDVENLARRLRREQVKQLAALLGRSVSDKELDDPTTESVLLAQAKAAGKLSPRLARRNAAVARARAALEAFMSKAELAKDPDDITRQLLHELGRLQRDGARWIAAAALEEELGRVENEEGFLTAELLAAIDAAPVPPDAKAAYKRRGENYQKRLKVLKENCTSALAALETDAWEKQAAQVEKLMAENSLLRRDLSRDISDYSKVPFRMNEARLVQVRWRVYAEDLAIRWLPSSGFAKTASERRGRLVRYREIFLKIAAGDLGNARQLLAAAEAR